MRLFARPAGLFSDSLRALLSWLWRASRSGLTRLFKPKASRNTEQCDPMDLTSEAKRLRAVSAYTERWDCPEASLARTAVVDRADLSKWKRCLLPQGSEKGNRIENVLRNNDAPRPPRRPQRSESSDQ